MEGEHLVLDGALYVIEARTRATVQGRRTDDDGRAVVCVAAVADLVAIAPGLFGVAGRMEPRAAKAGAVQVAAAPVAASTLTEEDRDV